MNPTPTHIYPVVEWSGYDADSYNLTLDLGFELICHRKVRINGLDTTELRDRRPNFKAFAYLAKRVAHAWVKRAFEGGGLYFNSTNYTGKYGRSLGDLMDSEGNSLTYFLLAKHVATPYHGQNKEDIEGAHLANMDFLSNIDGDLATYLEIPEVPE